MDSTVLADALDFVREHRLPIHSLLIVRNGYVVLDAFFWPFTDGERHDLASATKSITSTLVGISIGKGQIRDVNQSVMSVFPSVEVANRDKSKDKITIENLLTMTSGLECQFSSGELTLKQMRQSANWVQFVLDRTMAYPPGAHFEYCSPGMHVLSGILSRVTGVSEFEFARRELFTPLGIKDVDWASDNNGVTHGWGDLQMRPRDMAKIGYLWLNDGQWNGKQIVPSNYMRTATQIHSHAPWGEGYGYGIWVHPNVGAGGLFEANGRGGQRISVLRSEKIVLVITGGGFEPGDIAKFLLGSVKSTIALSENPAATARLTTAIAAAAQAPRMSRATAPILPEIAGRISDRLYVVEANPWNLRSFRFKFRPGSAPTLELTFSDSSSEVVAIGMDGVPLLSGTGIKRALASGLFTDTDTLIINYNQIARINDIEIKFRFAGKGVKINLLEKAGHDQMEFLAQLQ